MGGACVVIVGGARRGGVKCSRVTCYLCLRRHWGNRVGRVLLLWAGLKGAELNVHRELYVYVLVGTGGIMEGRVLLLWAGRELLLWMGEVGLG